MHSSSHSWKGARSTHPRINSIEPLSFVLEDQNLDEGNTDNASEEVMEKNADCDDPWFVAQTGATWNLDARPKWGWTWTDRSPAQGGVLRRRAQIWLSLDNVMVRTHCDSFWNWLFGRLRLCRKCVHSFFITGSFAPNPHSSTCADVHETHITSSSLYYRAESFHAVPNRTHTIGRCRKYYESKKKATTFSNLSSHSTKIIRNMIKTHCMIHLLFDEKYVLHFWKRTRLDVNDSWREQENTVNVSLEAKSCKDNTSNDPLSRCKSVQQNGYK